MTKFHAFIAQRGYVEPDEQYRGLFGFIWWFWFPRIHTQHPDEQNPRVVRLIWLCFAIGIEIWGEESKDAWPTAERQRTKESKP